MEPILLVVIAVVLLVVVGGALVATRRPSRGEVLEPPPVDLGTVTPPDRVGPVEREAEELVEPEVAVVDPISGILPPEVVRLQVFEANSANLSQAVKLATEPTALPWDRTGLSTGQARWYWLRSVSAEGNVSALIGPVTATAF